MILTCPSCSTRYQADSARFVAPGRNVRCAKCGHIWFQTTPEAEPEPEPVLEPLVAPPPDPEPSAPESVTAAPLSSILKPQAAETPPRPKKRKPQKGSVLADAIAWAALIFLAVTIGWAAVQYRQTIVELWPGVAPLYDVVGLPVETEGIALIDVAYQHEVEDGQQRTPAHCPPAVDVEGPVGLEGPVNDVGAAEHRRVGEGRLPGVHLRVGQRRRRVGGDLGGERHRHPQR